MRQEGKRPLLFLLVFLGECVLVLSPPAPAAQFEIYVGPGGESFTALCPSGYHMVGLEGRAGKWIDKMAPICGSWVTERQGFINRIVVKTAGTSEGGAAAGVACPHGYGLSKWTFWFAVGETLRPKFVSTIEVSCEAVVAQRGSFVFQFGNTETGYKYAGGGSFSAPSRPRPSGANSCPPGDLAVGFEGRSGQFVDALALICGPSPVKLNFATPPSQTGSAMTLQRPGKPSGPVGNPDPSLQTKLVPNYPTILSPAPGQQFFPLSVVPIKLASPPSVTTTNYEVAIQRKGTNGNWIAHHSFPIGPAEAQSPTGYQGFGAGGNSPTKLPPLLTSPGLWRLQARILQPTPMVWSPWVEFVVLPPLNKGTITQTPSNSLGTGPILIRPRGVEEKGGTEGNQTVDQPAEAGKKP